MIKVTVTNEKKETLEITEEPELEKKGTKDTIYEPAKIRITLKNDKGAGSYLIFSQEEFNKAVKPFLYHQHHQELFI